LLVGLVPGWVLLPLWARLREPTILITFSVLISYAVYILAEEVLHVSGILAVVSYGLYQGWRSPRIFPDASTRLQAVAFWGVLVFLLEALLFVLLGQQLPSILGGIKEELVWLALVYAAVVLVRFAWFFLTPYFHPVFDRLLRNPPGQSRCPATPGRGAVLTHAPVPSGAGRAVFLRGPGVTWVKEDLGVPDGQEVGARGGIHRRIRPEGSRAEPPSPVQGDKEEVPLLAHTGVHLDNRCLRVGSANLQLPRGEHRPKRQTLRVPAGR
jgi:hypothetical protein